MSENANSGTPESANGRGEATAPSISAFFPACNDGFASATKDLIFCPDGDAQYDPRQG